MGAYVIKFKNDFPIQNRDAYAWQFLVSDRVQRATYCNVIVSLDAHRMLANRIEQLGDAVPANTQYATAVTIARDGLSRLEAELKDGVALGRVHEILFGPDDVGRLLESAVKSCGWRGSGSAGPECRASDSSGRRTARAMCRACWVPDRREVCTELVHISTSLHSYDVSVARVATALCNLGHHEAGDKCGLFGWTNDCWQREVEVLPSHDAPPDVAARVTDELDYPVLAWRERLHETVWTFAHARSIESLLEQPSTGQEFQTCLASLADLIDKLRPPSGYTQKDGETVGSLVGLGLFFADKYPALVPEVERLKLIRRTRNAWPIHSVSSGVLEAFSKLGVSYPTDDWVGAWRQVLGAFWVSVRSIRLGIQSSPLDGGLGEVAGSPSLDG